MTASQWYYSEGDQEVGPVSIEQLRQRAADGRMTADDLVWSDGMPDWTPAGEVPGLLPSQNSPQPGPQRPAVPRSAVAARRDWAGTVRSALGQNPRGTGHALLAVGIMLVLTARGCDRLGRRNVQRQQARYDTAIQRFDDDWEAQRLNSEAAIRRLSDERDEIQEELDQTGDAAPSPEASDEFNMRLDAIADEIRDHNDRIREMVQEQATDKDRLTIGRWRSLKIAARDADRNNSISGYWRELWFVFGTQLLTLGLLITGFTGGRAERWISLIMLAIITFSIYVGGTAWIGSVGVP